MPTEQVFQNGKEKERSETKLPLSPGTRHDLMIENRSSLTATGVLRVISYDEASAMAQTGQGILIIGGKDLKVSELSSRSGELRVQGEIEYIQYEPDRRQKGSLLGRFLR